MTPRALDAGKGHRIDLNKAASIIRSGGVVAFPTESFYGLGVSAWDEKAIQRLFTIKKREENQPILLLIPSTSLLNQYVIRIPDIATQMMEKFWPGGLTLIFEANPDLPRLLTSGTGKIGLRLSSHPVATALTRAVGAPITGTSANIAGQAECSSAEAVRHSLGGSVDFVLDGGETGGKKGSTVMDITVDPPMILREGMVTREQLEAYIK
ncbi:MAG: threonylcarbamoyl-AMP synthase [Deltaproteobacteria bacterium]|nr:threonylcarbamoyl-AMP synthase [Deltaproteobacteria bacterium]